MVKKNLRDLVGYGSKGKKITWPNNSKLALQFVLNYEEGGENSVLNGDKYSETFLSEIINAKAIKGRHISMESIYEYGSRAGFWRLDKLFKEKKIPVFIANFVLMEYGLGAIFGCPAHDQRDLDFANEYNLEVVSVVKPVSLKEEEFIVEKIAFTENGKVINSDFLNGLTTEKAKNKIIDVLEEKKIGCKKINYKLRDWGISRQRFWGCPIPIIYREDGKWKIRRARKLV